MTKTVKNSITPSQSSGGVITLLIILFTILLDRFLNLFLDSIEIVKWYQSEFLYKTLMILLLLFIYNVLFKESQLSNKIVTYTKKDLLAQKRFEIKVIKADLEYQSLEIKYAERERRLRILRANSAEIEKSEYSYEEKVTLYNQNIDFKRGK